MMKVAIVFVLLALGAFAGETPEPHMNCLPQVDFAFFDLRGLESDNNTDFVSKQNINPFGEKIYFSLCQPTKQNCSKKTHAAHVIPDRGCVSLSTVKPVDASFKMLNEKNRSEGIKVLLTGGDEGSNFTLNIRCGNKTQINYFKNLKNKYYEVNMIHPAGCPKLDVKPIYSYISGEEWILKIALLVVGLLLTFMGRQLVKPAIFVLAFGIIFVSSTYIIFSYFITANTPVWTLWTLLGVCALAGLLVGALAAYLEVVGFFFVGSGLGYAFGNFLMYSIIIHTNIGNPAVVQYVVMMISGVIFGLAMVKFRDVLMILATSLFGALMVSRTFLAMVAALPTEPQILEMFKNGQSIPSLVWAYLALYVVLAGLGIYVQKSRKSPEWETKEALVQHNNPYSYYQRA